MRSKTESIFEGAKKIMPGGVSSPVRAFKGLGLTPMVVESGNGDLIWDTDGHEYIDYCCSWGAHILGHAHPAVVAAATEQLQRGSSFGITTRKEIELAEKIARHIPSIEKIRFVSSGTEATMTALRIARAATGRSKIVKFSGHYHGHSDSLLVQAGSGALYLNSQATSKGVLNSVIANTISLPFNDFGALRSFFLSPLAHETAAIILEPIAANMGVIGPSAGFLETLSQEAAKVGALLIFDEVITGFRLSLQGAQGIYPVIPDLTCLGKIIGGGFPAAAVGGKKIYMDLLAPIGEVYQAGTLSGNPVAMAGGFATLSQLEKPSFYEELEAKAKRFAEPIEKALQATDYPACFHRAGSMMTLFFGTRKISSKEDLSHLDEQRFAHFFRTLFAQGIYLPPASQEAWFISSAHTQEHLDKTADLICGYIRLLT